MTLLPATLAAVLVAPLGAQSPPEHEDVGPGTTISELITRGDCRMAIIGDSISNKNTNTSLQSSIYWGIIRRWRPERWTGICTPVNGHFPTFSTQYPGLASADTLIRSLADLPGERTFSHGYERFAVAPTADSLWFADTPAAQTIFGARLSTSDEWRVDSWFAGVPVQASFILLRTPESIDRARIITDRGAEPPLVGPVISLAGPASITAFPAPSNSGLGEPSFRIVTAGPYDEAALPSHLIWLTTRIHRADTSGFQLDALAVGGSRLRDWLADGPYAADDRLREYLAATGSPNLFYIQLGANDGNFDATWRADLIQLIDRLSALSAPLEPSFLLIPPYGTELSITHEQALSAAAIEFDLAAVGTPAVPPSRIGFINIPRMLGGAIDQSLLIDSIHPRPAGADLIAGLVWQALTDEVYDPTCPPDMTGTSDPRNPLYGVPDGELNGEDLFYFLDGYSDGDPTRADLTSTPDPLAPGYGLPDGLVNQADLDYMLDALNNNDIPRGDLTGASDPISFDYGRPDGVVDADDFFYFLDQFVGGNLPRADLSGAADPADPAYGSPDGALDAADFFYFLDEFTQGCD